MTRVRVKGFKIFTDRHGKVRCYHRASGTPIDLAKAPIGSAEFFAECSRITALAVITTSKPGTLGLLVDEYRAAPAFTDLEPRTRADYQRVLGYLQPIADTPLVRFDKPLVVRIRDKAMKSKGRRFANYTKAVLSLVFAWGAERGYVEVNPAERIKDVRRKKGAPEANRPWSDEERDAVLDGTPPHIKAAVAVMMFTGLGPKDALTLPRSFYQADQGEIATRRSKTGEPVFWPVPSALAAILAETPQHAAVTLLANSDGRPWTESGFRASWRPRRMKLEKAGLIGPGLTLYGLRHTVATILREIGFEPRTIADALGQKTTAMAEHYSRRADLKPRMVGVVRDFSEEVNRRRTKVVKP